MTSFNLSQGQVITGTRLWNRAQATARIEEEMNRAKMDDGCVFTILLVQFDGLSASAHPLGYAFSEDMVRSVSAMLAEQVGPQDMCCRLGGDDFLLIFGGRRGSDCQGVIDSLTERWNAGAGTRESTIELSVGTACFPAHGRTLETLLSAADESMQGSRLSNEIFKRAVPEVRVA